MCTHSTMEVGCFLFYTKHIFSSYHVDTNKKSIKTFFNITRWRCCKIIKSKFFSERINKNIIEYFRMTIQRDMISVNFLGFKCKRKKHFTKNCVTRFYKIPLVLYDMGNKWYHFIQNLLTDLFLIIIECYNANFLGLME